MFPYPSGSGLQVGRHDTQEYVVRNRPIFAQARFARRHLLGGFQFPRCMGRSLAALPLAVSLDPLMDDLCRFLWRQPGPFRTACTDRHPDSLACYDPLLDGITTDCIEHLVSPDFVLICQTACLVGQPEDGTLTILVRPADDQRPRGLAAEQVGQDAVEGVHGAALPKRREAFRAISGLIWYCRDGAA